MVTVLLVWTVLSVVAAPVIGALLERGREGLLPVSRPQPQLIPSQRGSIAPTALPRQITAFEANRRTPGMRRY